MKLNRRGIKLDFSRVSKMGSFYFLISNCMKTFCSIRACKFVLCRKTTPGLKRISFAVQEI